MSESQQEKILFHQARVAKELKNPEFFDQFTIETLNNFAYRYFENANPAFKIQGEHHLYEVSAFETGIKEAIKIPHPELRLALKQLVLDFPPQAVTLCRRFQVRFADPERGFVDVVAALSFGHPNHEFEAGSFVARTTRFEYAEFMELRNRLAALLEQVAELYG